MCLAVFSWQPGSAVPLNLVANRDEFRQRPTQAMHWWPDRTLLAGKDLQAGGTWLGFNRRGYFALLTNIRPGFIGASSAFSRGDLVRDFLQGCASIEAYHRAILPRLNDYGGFNLVLGDARRLFYFSSIHPSGQWLAPGIHGLSNDSLNTPWPKTVLAKQQMRAWGDARLQSADRPNHSHLDCDRRAASAAEHWCAAGLGANALGANHRRRRLWHPVPDSGSAIALRGS